MLAVTAKIEAGELTSFGLPAATQRPGSGRSLSSRLSGSMSSRPPSATRYSFDGSIVTSRPSSAASLNSQNLSPQRPVDAQDLFLHHLRDERDSESTDDEYQALLADEMLQTWGVASLGEPESTAKASRSRASPTQRPWVDMSGGKRIIHKQWNPATSPRSKLPRRRNVSLEKFTPGTQWPLHAPSPQNPNNQRHGTEHFVKHVHSQYYDAATAWTRISHVGRAEDALKDPDATDQDPGSSSYFAPLPKSPPRTAKTLKGMKSSHHRKRIINHHSELLKPDILKDFKRFAPTKMKSPDPLGRLKKRSVDLLHCSEHPNSVVLANRMDLNQGRIDQHLAMIGASDFNRIWRLGPSGNRSRASTSSAAKRHGPEILDESASSATTTETRPSSVPSRAKKAEGSGSPMSRILSGTVVRFMKERTHSMARKRAAKLTLHRLDEEHEESDSNGDFTASPEPDVQVPSLVHSPSRRLLGPTAKLSARLAAVARQSDEDPEFTVKMIRVNETCDDMLERQQGITDKIVRLQSEAKEMLQALEGEPGDESTSVTPTSLHPPQQLVPESTETTSSSNAIYSLNNSQNNDKSGTRLAKMGNEAAGPWQTPSMDFDQEFPVPDILLPEELIVKAVPMPSVSLATATVGGGLPAQNNLAAASPGGATTSQAWRKRNLRSPTNRATQNRGAQSSSPT